MYRIAFRAVLAHRVRLVLTAMSATLGVAFVTGMLMLTAALDRTFTDIFTSTAQDVLITSQAAGDEFGSAELVPDSVVAQVAAVPGVIAVAGTATGAGVALLTADGDVVGGNGPPALGLTWLNDPELARAQIVDGRAPSAYGEIAVDEITFPRLGLPIGSTVEIAAREGRLQTTLVGVFRLGQGGGQAGLTVTAFVPEQAQQLLAEPGQWDSVEVAVGDGRTDDEVAADVREAIGPGFAVQTRQQQIDAAVSALQEGLGFLNTIVGVFAGIALFVAAFLIYNTFSMLIAQRSRELALLRAVGATRRQVLGSVLVEALLVALLAAALGVALGYLLAQGLSALLGLIGFAFSSGISLTVQAVAWAVGLAVAVIVASAALPAWRASRTAPVAALRTAGLAAEQPGRIRTVLGFALAGLAGWQLNQSLSGELDATATGIASAGLLVAGILLAPALAVVFSILVSRVLGVIAGVSGRIAGRNAGRAPGRVAATSSALMIGLALVTGITVIVASAQQSVNALVDRTFIGDLLITRDGRVFSPDIAAAVAAVPGVGLVVQQTDGPAQVDGRETTVAALGLQGDSPALAAVLGGASPEDLIAGQAVVAQTFATDFAVVQGSSLDIVFPGGQRESFTVAAVVADNPLLSGVVVPLTDFRANGGEPLDRAVFVAFDGTRPADETAAAVRQVAGQDPLLEVFSQVELKERNQESLNQLLYLVYGMLALSVVIAALGVVNTMALSVVERTRELGLLRAVGASRRQIRRLIRWEAVIVSVLGGLLGLGIGALAGAALRRSLQDDGLDILAIPWGSLGWLFVAAIVIGVVGAILPARRAARLDILRAIGSE